MSFPCFPVTSRTKPVSLPAPGSCLPLCALPPFLHLATLASVLFLQLINCFCLQAFAFAPPLAWCALPFWPLNFCHSDVTLERSSWLPLVKLPLHALHRRLHHPVLFSSKHPTVSEIPICLSDDLACVVSHSKWNLLSWEQGQICLQGLAQCLTCVHSVNMWGMNERTLEHMLCYQLGVGIPVWLWWPPQYDLIKAIYLGTFTAFLSCILIEGRLKCQRGPRGMGKN